MQYLAQIVTAINQRIATALNDKRFQGSDYNGIAVPAADGDVIRPLITDHYDDDKYISPDEQVPIIIYHRTIGIARTDDVKAGYGDEQTKKRETSSMALIAIGSRRLIRLTPEEMEAAIVAAMPSILKKETLQPYKLNSCQITPTNSVLDPVTVYLQEYKRDTFDLPPNALMIRVNYNIISAYDTACFNICHC